MIRQSKYTSGRKHTQPGWVLTESILSLALLGILLAAIAMAGRSGRDFNQVMLTRQQCVAAAQAQLDSIAATGDTIDDQKVTQLWPGVRVQVERTAGQAQWRDMTLVKATAAATAGGRNVKIELARYLPREDSP